ncbi:RNA-guided endonuclease TnpB family protein, partial [Ligilactobacillus pabuli]|uniref:RNA-guided endonuclease TnpB family protein n=1 Tax=Ligilactobacillus pabuli TaxID=2886039 RepID=UPI001FB899F9
MTSIAFKIRLYPNQKQINQMNRTFGSTRFLWNQMLAMQNERYENNHLAKYQNNYAMNLMLKPLKAEYPWLKDVDSTALQATNDHLHDAFQRFFNKELPNGHPRFKSKKDNAQSYTTKAVNQNIKVIDNHHLKLPKLG